MDREMGFTRQDFFNRLPRTLASFNYSITDNDITINLLVGKIHMHVGTEWERRLSEFVYFPVLPISIHFENVDEKTRNNFLQHFNISFQKGLG